MEWWHFFLINFGIIYFIVEILLIRHCNKKNNKFKDFLEINFAGMGFTFSCLIVVQLFLYLILSDCPNPESFRGCIMISWWLVFKWMWGVIGGIIGGGCILLSLKYIIYLAFVKEKGGDSV